MPKPRPPTDAMARILEATGETGEPGNCAELLVDGSVADAEPEAEPSAADLVEESRMVAEIDGVAQIDRLDRSAEHNGGRGVSDLLAQRHAVAVARTPDAGETPVLEFLGQRDRGGAASGNGDEGNGGQVGVHPGNSTHPAAG